MHTRRCATVPDAAPVGNVTPKNHTTDPGMAKVSSRAIGASIRAAASRRHKSQGRRPDTLEQQQCVVHDRTSASHATAPAQQMKTAAQGCARTWGGMWYRVTRNTHAPSAFVLHLSTFFKHWWDNRRKRTGAGNQHSLSLPSCQPACLPACPECPRMAATEGSYTHASHGDASWHNSEVVPG